MPVLVPTNKRLPTPNPFDFPILRYVLFGGGYEKTREEALGFPPEFLFDGSAMNQFKLIAICLGLASSALGTCTSSIPSL
jgi:hypothetical protein